MGPDAHYFYANTLEEAEQMKITLQQEVPDTVRYNIYIYVETSLGHLRVR